MRPSTVLGFSSQLFSKGSPERGGRASIFWNAAVVVVVVVAVPDHGHP